MQRSCDICGKPYEAVRSTSRYCSSTCRSRAHLSGQSVPTLAVIAEHPASPGRVTAATRAEAEALGQEGSALAEAALVLALQVDALPDPRTLPALTREWRATMAELRAASVGVSVNPLDELRRRRDSRAG